MERPNRFTVVDGEGQSHGNYATLDEARGCVHYDRLTTYQIFRDDKLVADIDKGLSPEVRRQVERPPNKVVVAAEVVARFAATSAILTLDLAEALGPEVGKEAYERLEWALGCRRAAMGGARDEAGKQGPVANPPKAPASTNPIVNQMLGLGKYVGATVRIEYADYGRPEQEVARIDRVVPFRCVETPNGSVPFIGFGVAIIRITVLRAGGAEQVVYHNPNIGEHYDVRDRVAVNVIRHASFGRYATDTCV